MTVPNQQQPSDAGRARAADGAHIVWRSTGGGDPPLLISGQAVDSRSWDALIPMLATLLRVITFDHRGIGNSDAGDDDRYSTRGFAQDAVAVLDDARVERALVYGHSMGGLFAQWLALDAPQRLGALVLGATTAGDTRGVPRSAAASADLASGDPTRTARLFFQSGQWRADAAAFFVQQATRHARRLHYAASRQHDTWNELPRITAPTLVIPGTGDEMTPVGNAELVVQAIPAAELHLIEGARHGHQLEGQAASEVVIRFLPAHSAALTRRP
jgi:pimeloyl-ACP methyl ester carboxylesterase